MFDVTNKRVTVMGLGLHGGGLGMSRWLIKHGAKIVVTDLKSAKQLAGPVAELKKLDPSITFVLGEHREKDFTDTDLVIKNPGVPSSSPYLSMASKAGVPITTDIGIFVSNFPGTIVGVTGTKGKTTTTTVLHQMIEATGKSVLLGGNLRKSPLDQLDAATKKTIAILELSSFQLEAFAELKFSPHVAVWTNIFPDHLDRYNTMEEYIAAKANIIKFQKSDDVFVTNADQTELEKLAETAKSKVVFFSATKELTHGAYVKDGALQLSTPDGQMRLCSIADLKIVGSHNVENMLAASAAAHQLGVSIEIIKKVLTSFQGVDNRLQTIRTVGGVDYINDTASTIPSSTIAALDAFARPIVLIAGGAEKNLPIDELAAHILEKAKKVVLLDAPVSKKLLKKMHELDATRTSKLTVSQHANSMQSAVELASKEAVVGDVVLLSPGAASFGMFTNEFDRGDQFVEAVKKL